MRTANHRRTPALNNVARAGLDRCLKRKLQNPEFRCAYDAENRRRGCESAHARAIRRDFDGREILKTLS
jgi:hypothetical protein